MPVTRISCSVLISTNSGASAWMGDRLKELNVTETNYVYEDTISVSLNIPFGCTVELFSHGNMLT